VLEVSLAESDREVAGTGPVLQPGKRSVPARLPQPGPRADRRLILYDDLDPHALDTGIVHFDGRYFGALWDICKRRHLSVIADVHVHPGGSGQSGSDHAHPMISRAGHIALILPNFARAPIEPSAIGICRYLGNKRWHSVPPAARRAFLHIGL
jgi:hypothetical protein